MQAQGGEEEQQHSMQLAEPPHCAASACALHSPQPVAAPWADSRWVGGALQQQPPAAGAQPSAAAGAAASLLQEPQLSQAIATPDDSLLGGLGLDFCDMQLPELTTPWAGCTAASWEGSDLRRHTCSLSLQSRQSVQLQPPAAPGQPFQGLAAGQAAGLARACSPLDPAPGPFYEAQPGGCAPQLQTPPADAGRRQYQQHQQQQPAICHSLFMEQAAVPVPTPLPVPASGVEFPEQWRGGAPACSSQHQQERQQQQRAPPHRWGRPQQRQQQQQPWAQLDSRRELPELPHRSCRLAEPPARTGLTAHSALLGGRRDPTAMAGATLWSPFLPSAGQGECDRGTPWRAGAGAAALPAPSRGTPARAPPPASQGAALGSPRSCLLPSPASQLPSLPLSFQLGGLAAEGSRLLGSVESLEDLPPHLLTKMQSIGIALLDLVQHATSALGAEVTSAARPPAEHPPQQPQQPPAATCCLQAAAAASALPWLSGGGGLLELVGQANGRTGSSSGQPAGLASSWSCLPAQPPLPAHAAGSGSQLAGLMPHVLGPPQQAQQDRALAPPLGLQVGPASLRAVPAGHGCGWAVGWVQGPAPH